MINPTTIRQLIKAKPQVPFLSKLNLWEILDETVVGMDLQMAAGFELSNHPDIFLGTEEEIGTHVARIRKFLHSVPDGLSLQFVIQARNNDLEGIESYLKEMEKAGRKNEFSKMILREKEVSLRKKFTQKKTTLLFINAGKPDKKMLPERVSFSLVDKDFPVFVRDLHEQRIRCLNFAAETVKDSLKDFGIEARRLSNNELLQYFYEHLNPKKSSSIKLVSQAQVSLRSQLIQSAARHEFEYFAIDQVKHRAVNLLLLPEDILPSDLTEMLNELWPDYDLSLTVNFVDSEKLIQKLKSQTNIAKAFSFSNLGSRYEAEQKFQELDELIREMRASTQELFTISLCVLIKELEEEKLDTQTEYVTKAFRTLGAATAISDNMNHQDLFLSFLPNHSQLNDRQHIIHSEPLANLVPLTASWKGGKRSAMLFENPQGELVRMDLFDPELPAKNAVIVGTTGSGKSFATNYLLTHFLIESEKNHVVVIDIGGSYRKLCRLFDGEYFNVELSEEFAFSPLPAKNGVWDGKEFDEDEIAYLTLILERMVLDQTEVLNSLGEAILEKALKRAYRATEGEASPSLMDVRRELCEIEGDEEVRELALHFFKNMEVWTEGRYSKVFQTKKEIELKSRLIVFDLEKLAQHPRLQSVYFYVIREIIDSKLRNRELRKIIVIDEGWRFFDDAVGAQLIENLYRTVRKFNGGVLSISQSPVDFLNTKAANAIVTNSHVKYILKLSKGHEYLSSFGLSKGEIEAVKNLSSVPRKFSDLYLKFNNNGTILRIEPSSFEYWICTTDADDMVREMNLRKEHPDWVHFQIIRALSEKYKIEQEE